MLLLTTLITLLTTAAAAGPSGDGTPASPMFDTDVFRQTWHDGKAEIAGYDLTTPRYGAPRRGTAVTVFVTEPFSNAARVKADPGKHPPGDEFGVIKLNLVEDFPTGVYDYNLMTSVFVALQPVNGLPAGNPTKVSFTAQEWCGHVYEQMLFDSGGKIRVTRHSYFDGEADANETLDYPRGGVSEDALLLWARGMSGPFLRPGESVEAPLLRGVKSVRMNHVRHAWQQARFTRQRDPRTVKVPAGDFEVEVRTVEPARTDRADTRWTIYVERAWPHRIVKWETSAGESAELVGAERLTYWQMNGPGFEEAVRKFGLTPRPPRTP